MIELYIPRVGKKDECPNINNRGVPGGLWTEDGTELDGDGLKCSKYELRVINFIMVWPVENH